MKSNLYADQINPYLTNGFSHHYQFGESTFTFRGVRSDFIYFFFLSHFSMKILCKQNSLRRDAAFCGVTSGAMLFAYDVCLCPTKRTPGLNVSTVFKGPCERGPGSQLNPTWMIEKPLSPCTQLFAVVSTCNILAEYVVAGYGLISLPSTVKAILS